MTPLISTTTVTSNKAVYIRSSGNFGVNSKFLSIWFSVGCFLLFCVCVCVCACMCMQVLRVRVRV